VLYLESVLAGLLVGAVYAVLRVRSPAPPLTGLTGLAGMLIGFAAAGALL
jgi:XapX domain-containing protein